MIKRGRSEKKKWKKKKGKGKKGKKKRAKEKKRKKEMRVWGAWPFKVLFYYYYFITVDMICFWLYLERI